MCVSSCMQTKEEWEGWDWVTRGTAAVTTEQLVIRANYLCNSLLSSFRPAQ